jgi:hypothetical protein
MVLIGYNFKKKYIINKFTSIFSLKKYISTMVQIKLALVLLALVSATIAQSVTEYDKDIYGGPRLVNKLTGNVHLGGRGTVFKYLTGVYMVQPPSTFIEETTTPDCVFISDAFPQITNCRNYPQFINDTQLSFHNWTMTFTDLNFSPTDGVNSDQSAYDGFASARYLSSGIWDEDVIKPNGYVVVANGKKFDFQTVMRIELVKNGPRWKISKIQKAFDNMKMNTQLNYPWAYDDCLTEYIFPQVQNLPSLARDCIDSFTPRAGCGYTQCDKAV